MISCTRLLLLPAVLAASILSSPPVAIAATSPTTVHGRGLYGARWNPCAPITYRIKYQGGYRGSVPDIRHAVRTIASATGMRFVEVSSADADITWAWATPAKNPNLAGTVAGAMATTSIEHDGIEETVGGWIDLDRTTRLRPGFPTSGSPSWGQVYLHELAHVVGLSHVASRTQVMNPAVSSQNHILGSGDRSRLHRVGRAAGCVPHSAR